jgi:hypothetical protein
MRTRVLTSLVTFAIALASAAPAQVVTTVVNNGPSAELYDMVILGDGYTAAQQGQFHQDVVDVINYFQTRPQLFPYGAYFHCYNVHTVFRASAESGADQPPLGIFRNTVYDASYWIGGTERCLYVQNSAQAAADAALAPDTDGRVIVLVNDSKYGGCASTFSVSYNGSLMEDVQAHEWGHSFGGLADEYEYGASGTYSGPEFGEPNVTNSATGNKWNAWLGFAGPQGTVGAYVGARYYAAGTWRPEPDCEMRSLQRNFCTICREHFIVQFHRYCDMITQQSPAGTTAVNQGSSAVFSFVNRIASRPHTIEWRIDNGPWVAGGTTFTWNVGTTSLGSHTISLRLRDTSLQVRRDPSGYLIHTHAWNVDVLPVAPKTNRALAEHLPEFAPTRELAGSSSLPLNSAGTRTMLAYSGSMLGHAHPVHIAAIAFRPEGGTAQTITTNFDLRVDVSTGRHSPASLSTTFAANHGADRSKVLDRTLTIPGATLGGTPSSFVLVIPFDEPFVWDPRLGPLLVDVRVRGIVSGTGAPIDADAFGVDTASRLIHTSDPDAAIASVAAPQDLAPALQLLLACEATPQSLVQSEGNSASSVPFGTTTGTRVQMAYEPTTLGYVGRHRITRLAFRRDLGGSFGGGSYDLRVELATAAAGITGTMSSTFAQNLGADATAVFDGVLFQPPFAAGGAPTDFAFQIELTRPFDHDPSAGALLVDITLRSSSVSQSPTFDGMGNTGVGVRRVFAPSATASSGSPPEDFALAMAVSAFPVPVVPQALDHTLGALSSPYPWSNTGPMRTLYQYAPSMLAGTQAIEITHLAWRPAAGSTPLGPVTANARIDLSTGFLAPLSTILAGNHGSDLTTVFEGDFSVPYTDAALLRPDEFPIVVALDRPFRWDPSRGPLIVDIRKSADVAGIFGGALDATTVTGVGGRVMHTTDRNALLANLPPQNIVLAMKLGGRGGNGLGSPYGSGCGGSPHGVPINSSVDRPFLGNREFAYALHRAAPSAPALLLWGLAPQNLPLTVLGAPSCSLLHDGLVGSVGTLTDTAGFASWPSPLPVDPALSGATLRTQWLVVDPSGIGVPVPVALTPGLEITIR